MTAANRVTVLSALLLLASLAVRAQAPAPIAATAAPVQPIPYSHKQHLAIGLDCAFCHTRPEPGKLMTYPAAATCMSCHRTIAADRASISKLAGLAAAGTPIPWVRVYKTPDYVYWKHAPHLEAGVTCAECHGKVADRDVIVQETNVVTMAGCLACHNKRQVYTDCGDCHAPRQ